MRGHVVRAQVCLGHVPRSREAHVVIGAMRGCAEWCRCEDRCDARGRCDARCNDRCRAVIGVVRVAILRDTVLVHVATWFVAVLTCGCSTDLPLWCYQRRVQPRPDPHGTARYLPTHTLCRIRSQKHLSATHTHTVFAGTEAASRVLR